MAKIDVRPLREDLSFGSRITGVTRESSRDEALRREINAVFEERGLIVFEDVEPSGRMHVALSDIFGPLKDHPVASVDRVDQDAMPGVIDMAYDPKNGGVYEIDGQRLAQWLPWHFDHCYNNELNRAGVLRAIDIPPEGGLTGFADGIQLYKALPAELRARIEDKRVLYNLEMRYDLMRFGRPKNVVEIAPQKGFYDVLDLIKTLPRAIHPAVWTRAGGEKVLHVSPWMSLGIEGHEDPEGDALLSAVCDVVNANEQVYFHKWKPTDMLVWDNWRLLHAVSGCDPKYARRMQRTTIKGDYGLGCFENDGTGHKILETTV